MRITDVIELERNEHGMRVRVLPWHQRIHHGTVGLILLSWKRTRALGVILIADDLHDWRDWFVPGPQRG